MSKSSTAEAKQPATKAAKQSPQITATGEQVLDAVSPVKTIVEENWPFEFEGGYWLGKLMARLLAEKNAIETGRQSLLRQFAKVNAKGVIETHENGHAKFEEGQHQLYQEKLKEEMAKPRVLEGVRPIRASDFSKETRKKLKTEKVSGAALGMLAGTPFFDEDVPLFGG